MIRVFIESPYVGDYAANKAYLKRCMRDSLMRGEAPFASHRLYPGALDDTVLEERELGIAAGEEWRLFASKTVFYMDLGFSPGMQKAFQKVRGSTGLFTIEWRWLDKQYEGKPATCWSGVVIACRTCKGPCEALDDEYGGLAGGGDYERFVCKSVGCTDRSTIYIEMPD